VKKLWETLKTRSVEQLTRAAAVLALIALAIIVFSVLFPRPLPVIFAMSAGHVIGGAAFACYLIAVLLDVARSGTSSTSIAPGARPSGDVSKK
jgi:protein-S-isoprenylcysteine O-methyltransferase Ste14